MMDRVGRLGTQIFMPIDATHSKISNEKSLPHGKISHLLLLFLSLLIHILLPVVDVLRHPLLLISHPIWLCMAILTPTFLCSKRRFNGYGKKATICEVGYGISNEIMRASLLNWSPSNVAWHNRMASCKT